jgi:hypothetical protein
MSEKHWMWLFVGALLLVNAVFGLCWHWARRSDDIKKAKEEVLELQKTIAFQLQQIEQWLRATAKLESPYPARLREVKEKLGILVQYSGNERHVDWLATLEHLKERAAPIRALWQDVRSYAEACEFNAWNLELAFKLNRFVYVTFGPESDNQDSFQPRLMEAKYKIDYAKDSRSVLEAAYLIAAVHRELIKLCALKSYEPVAGTSQEARPDWLATRQGVSSS